MTLARRLERLTPALTVQERFLMSLDQYKRGVRFTVDLAGLLPSELEEYLGYCRAVTAVNFLTEGLAPLIGERAAWLEDDLARVANLEEAAEQLEEEYALPREEPPRDWRKSKGEIGVAAFLRALAVELREDLQKTANHLWVELLAARTVFGEIERELGVDPMHPRTSSALAEAEAQVESLRRRLGLTKNPRTDARVVAHLQSCVRAMRRADELVAGL